MEDTETADAPTPTRRNMWPALAALIVLAMMVLAYFAGYSSVETTASTPGSSSPEAGFSRAMQVHHNQGVELAMIVRDRSDNPDFRLIAYDMALVQSQQSGQMYGWLSAWGVPQYSPDDAMAWMDDLGEHAHSTPQGDLMPGLATAEQLETLRAAEGTAAEVIFLELMIEHHKGALDMAEGILELSDVPEVTTLAQSILDSQAQEIALMESMLAERQ